MKTSDPKQINYTEFFKSIPLKSAKDVGSTKWHSTDSGCGIIIVNGTESTNDDSSTIYVAKDIKTDSTFAETPTDNRISFDLPKYEFQVEKDGKKLSNKNLVTPNADGSIKIDLDIYKHWLDSGGYYTRQSGEIILDIDGNIKFIDVRDYMASRAFLFFGSIGKFKEAKRITCGER